MGGRSLVFRLLFKYPVRDDVVERLVNLCFDRDHAVRHECHDICHCGAAAPDLGGILKMRRDKFLTANYFRNLSGETTIRLDPALGGLRHAAPVTIMIPSVGRQTIAYVGANRY